MCRGHTHALSTSVSARCLQGPFPPREERGSSVLPGSSARVVRWQKPPLFLPCSQPTSRAVFAPGQPPGQGGSHGTKIFDRFPNPSPDSPGYWEKGGRGRFPTALPLVPQFGVFARQSFESALLHFSLLVAPKGGSLLVIGAPSVQKRIQFCSLLE